MKLVELHIKGFGKLVDHGARFAPGFNLIYGPNEAGKSTLQQAILTLLYGFYDEGTVTAAKRATLSGLQPWNPRAAYAGSLTYQLDSGQSFRVERTFGPRLTTTLWSLAQNIDVSGRFRSASQGRLFFADEHLGMRREVFEKTCFVRQAELVALETSADVITDTLMRLSTAATTDTTTTQAIALLDDLMKEAVGTARARTKPLPRAQDRLASLEQERRAVVQRRSELFSQIAALRQSEERLAHLDQHRQRLRYLHLLAEARAASDQYASATMIAEDVRRWSEERERWAAWRTFPAHLHSEVVGLAIHRRKLQKEISASLPQRSAAEEQLQAIEAQAALLRQRVATLADVRDVRTADLSGVQELARQWRSDAEHVRVAEDRWQKARGTLAESEQQLDQKHAQIGPAIMLGLSELAALQQRLLNAHDRLRQATAIMNQAQETWARTGMSEAQFRELEQTVQSIQSGIIPAPAPRKGCRSIITREPTPIPSQPSTELVIYADLKPLYTNLLQAHANVAEAQRQLSEIESSIVQQLGGVIGAKPDERALAVLSQQLERHLQLTAAVEQQRSRLAQVRSEFDEARHRYEAAHARLRTRLVELGATQEDTQVALESYLRRCEQRLQLDRDMAQLEQLRLQMERLRRDIEAGQTQQAALDEAEQQLRALLVEAGIDLATGTIEDALARFGTAVNNHKRWVESEAAYQAAIRHQQPSPRNETRTDQQQDTEVRIATLRADRPEWPALQPDKTLQEYNQLIWQADKEWADVRQEHSHLQDALQQIARTLRHPAEIDEDIALTRRQITRLEQLRDALETARTQIIQTAEDFQRRFAPQLELLMSEGLSRVTRSRYSDVRIDPSTLSVTVRAPEIDDYISAKRLSTGTRDIVYLMLRISIAQLMSQSQERLPLLLDDPLVQCDHNRQQQALEVLCRLAEQHQILLFTKDEMTCAWFEKHCGSTEMHQMHILHNLGEDREEGDVSE